MIKTLIVTGGAGFIGSNFVRYMLGVSDTHIVCVDKLTYAGSMSSLEGITGDKRFTFVRADICDRAAMREVFGRYKPEAVINFAAESHVDRSITDPGIFVTTNIIGVQTLMDCCLETGAHFHQISTDEVYGDLPADSEQAFDEQSPLRPSGPYSASKASADLLALAYRRTYGLSVTITRSSNNYGCFQHTEKFIPHMIMCALEGRNMPVYGDGSNVRDWLHVSDHCRALKMILDGGREEVYNIAGHNEISNLRLAETICDILGKPRELIMFVSDRKGHDIRYSMKTDKLTSDTGWRPVRDFKEGLEETVRWYAAEKAAGGCLWK